MAEFFCWASILGSETTPPVMKEQRENQPREESTWSFAGCITEGEENIDDSSLSILSDLSDYDGLSLDYTDYNTPEDVKITSIQNEKNSEEDTGKSSLRYFSYLHDDIGLVHKDSNSHGGKTTTVMTERYSEYEYSSKRKSDGFVHLATAAELTEVFEEDLNPLTKQLRRLHDSISRSETTRAIVILQRQAMALKSNTSFTEPKQNGH
jgi:hypothetical protein